MHPGRYRHYKGNDYIVIGVARHSETEEELVVYRTDYGDRSLWVRPRTMFEETVDVDGERVPRFRFVSDALLSRSDRRGIRSGQTSMVGVGEPLASLLRRGRSMTAPPSPVSSSGPTITRFRPEFFAE